MKIKQIDYKIKKESLGKIKHYLYDTGILFDNGYKIVEYHRQDCYENVYADWSVLPTYNVSLVTGQKINIYDIDFPEKLKDMVRQVKGAGFNMTSKIGERFFVPCYNEQNGYYNDELKLVLLDKEDKLIEKLDITETCKFKDIDDIDDIEDEEE